MKQLTMPVISFLMITHSLAQNTESITVNFDFNKYIITAGAVLRLDSFISKISNRSISLIQLNGHTDSKGSDIYNDELSLKRVNAVRAYLRAKEIYDSITFTDKGLGKRHMLNTENTDQQKLLNRRVEIIVTYKNNFIDRNTINPVRSIEAVPDDTLTKKGAVVVLQNLQFEAGTTNFYRHLYLFYSNKKSIT